MAPEVRGHKLGGHLLDAMLDRLRQAAVREVFLEVRESNAAARGLYRARGLRKSGDGGGTTVVRWRTPWSLRLALESPA